MFFSSAMWTTLYKQNVKLTQGALYINNFLSHIRIEYSTYVRERVDSTHLSV